MQYRTKEREVTDDTPAWLTRKREVTDDTPARLKDDVEDFFVKAPLQRSKQELLLAALCKCALDPRDFNNHLFWKLIYDLKIYKGVTDALDKLDCENGTQAPIEKTGVRLGVSGNVHYFACWPNLDQVIDSFVGVIEKEVLRSILLSCCINNSTLKNNVSCLIDKIYREGLIKERDDDLKSVPPRSSPISILSGYVGNDLHFKPSCASIWLKILGGFIAALGAVAIVLALMLLSPPSAAVAVSGAAALVVGLGMFKVGRDKPQVLSPDNTVSQSNYCPF